MVTFSLQTCSLSCNKTPIHDLYSRWHSCCPVHWNPTGFVHEAIKPITLTHSDYFKPGQRVFLYTHPLPGEVREFNFPLLIEDGCLSHSISGKLYIFNTSVTAISSSVLCNLMAAWLSAWKPGSLSHSSPYTPRGIAPYHSDHSNPLSKLTSSWSTTSENYQTTQPKINHSSGFHHSLLISKMKRLFPQRFCQNITSKLFWKWSVY